MASRDRRERTEGAIRTPARGQSTPVPHSLTPDDASIAFGQFMSATDAVAFIKDSAGRYIFMNDQLLERFGFRSDLAWLGRTDADLWPPETAAAIAAVDARIRETDSPSRATQMMPMGDATKPFLVTKFPIHTPDGLMIGGLGIDISDEIRTTEALRRSQELLTTATEISGIGVWEFDGSVHMANAVTEDWDLAAPPSLGTPLDLGTLLLAVHPDDRQLILDATAAALRDGHTLERDFRITTLDGGERWLRALGRRVSGPDGDRLVGISRDVTDELAATASIRQQATILQSVQDAIIVTDPAGLVTYWSGAAERLLGRDAPSVLGRSLADIEPELADPIGEGTDAIAPDDEREILGPDGTALIVGRRTRSMSDAEGRPTGAFMIVADITERVARERDLQRLSMAVEQSADAIVITDTSARIQYVNPAFEATTGYSRDEVIGQNPRLLKSGVQSDAFYTAMWAALSKGQPWVADLVNRRKDGTLFEEEAVISPIRDANGVVTSYLAVKRNVTRERALEAQAIRLGRERALISDTLATMRPVSSPEETAQMICQQVAGLTGVAAAVLLRLAPDGRYHAMGGSLATGETIERRTIPLARSRHLHESARRGPWVEKWISRPWHPYNKLFASLGAATSAYAPVSHAGVLFGLMAIVSEDAVSGTLLESLPALVEFAGIAGAMIGPNMVATEAAQVARSRIAGIIRDHAFRPVFQPIVELRTGHILGFEALTRFDDGVGPDDQFAAADAVGLGIELEVATLRAAFDAATGLGPKELLNINVSPALALEGTALRSLVRRLPRRVVLEITEHTAIDDYEAFHRAVRRIGPGVRLAVDDAGAGFASFRHILELRPAYVKLDRSLVAGIDTDPAKQGLAAGMRQFAQVTHCRLIAEGVETEAERAMLLSLDIHYAQGFLLGRPGVLVAALPKRP